MFSISAASHPGASPARSPRRVRLHSALPLFLLGLLALSACATKADIRDLRESLVELTAQQNALLRLIQAEQDAQSDSIQALAGAVLELRGESLRRMANLEDHLLRVQELAGLSQQELARVRDQMERDRAAAAFGGQGVPGLGASSASADAEAIFLAALGQFNRRIFGAARSGFEDVVRDHGSDPLAPEARFYLADILEQEGDQAGAVQAFLQIPEYHPAAPRVPQALYRAALLEIERGRRDEARILLERVVNSWPEGGEADLARAALQGLR